MNHLQLQQAALPDLSESQISRLPKDQLAHFSNAVQQLHDWTLQMRGRINRGMKTRYADQIRHAATLGQGEAARFRIDDGDLQIDVSQPKEIVWDQKHLSEIAERMVVAGDRVQDFMQVQFSVAESIIAPSLPALYEKFPRLHIEVLADDRLADMARDGIDIAIRTAAVHSETLVARQIGTASRTLYASPAYLAKNGRPQHPDDLSSHHLIGNSRASSMNLWERQDAKSGLQVKGHTLTDNSAVLLSMVRYGVGIARLLDIVAAPLVKSGELVPLLRPHFDVQEIPVYAVMLQERHRLPKMRACVEFWGEYLIRISGALPK